MTERTVVVGVDAQLSPAIAAWLTSNLGVALPLRELGLRDAKDHVTFAAARTAAAVVMTKDSDFVQLLERFGRRRKLSGSRAGTRPMRASASYFRSRGRVSESCYMRASR